MADLKITSQHKKVTSTHHCINVSSEHKESFAYDPDLVLYNYNNIM